LTDVAAADGLGLRFDRIRPGNTFDAHRLLHLALDHGMQDAVKERFLRAYLTDGEAIGDPEVLARLACEAGLGADDVTRVLATEAYAHAVRYDEEEASALGIHGVPFFVIGGHHAVSGAQTAEVLLGALELSWAEAEAAEGASFAEGAVCGPDGCA
jgi:predicted DsbA family dithiol-disulfide isomerase